MTKRILAFLISFCLIFEQTGFAQLAIPMGIPGYLSSLAPAADKFRPIHLRSIDFNSGNNNLELILDKGDLKDIQPRQLEETTKELYRYFQIGLALPNKYFWVNLRPDSPDEVIEPLLAKTDLGRVMLEADLQLKKDLANFTSPQTPEGKLYWDRLYLKAGELYNQQDIQIPTLTRPWIVPGEAVIRSSQTGAFVYKATLKVMLEQDYIKDSPNYNFNDPRQKELNAYSSQLIRELIIPKLGREVNSSRRYARLRQVYYSLILAQWFKNKSHVTSHMSQVDSKDLSGLTSKTPWSKDTYYQAYRKSFQKGEYNSQEQVSSVSGVSIRRYFSGGIEIDKLPEALTVIQNGPGKSADGFSSLISGNELPFARLNIDPQNWDVVDSPANPVFKEGASNPTLPVQKAAVPPAPVQANSARQYQRYRQSGIDFERTPRNQDTLDENYFVLENASSSKKSPQEIWKDIDAQAESMHVSLESEYGFLPRSAGAEVAAVYDIFERLVAAYNTVARMQGHPQFGGKLFIVDSPQINAFVFAGHEDVYLHWGIVRELARFSRKTGTDFHEDTIAAVLAHELTHVIQNSSYYGIAYAERYEHQMQEILTLTRNAELDADTGAIKLLSTAGYSPEGMLSVLDFLKKTFPEQEIISFGSHPHTKARLAAVELYFNDPHKVIPTWNTRNGELDARAYEAFTFRHVSPCEEGVRNLTGLTKSLMNAASLQRFMELARLAPQRLRLTFLKSQAADTLFQDYFSRQVFAENLLLVAREMLHDIPDVQNEKSTFERQLSPVGAYMEDTVSQDDMRAVSGLASLPSTPGIIPEPEKQKDAFRAEIAHLKQKLIADVSLSLEEKNALVERIRAIERYYEEFVDTINRGSFTENFSQTPVPLRGIANSVNNASDETGIRAALASSRSVAISVYNNFGKKSLDNRVGAKIIFGELFSELRVEVEDAALYRQNVRLLPVSSEDERRYTYLVMTYSVIHALAKDRDIEIPQAAFFGQFEKIIARLAPDIPASLCPSGLEYSEFNLKAKKLLQRFFQESGLRDSESEDGQILRDYFDSFDFSEPDNILSPRYALENGLRDPRFSRGQLKPEYLQRQSKYIEREGLTKVAAQLLRLALWKADSPEKFEQILTEQLAVYSRPFRIAVLTALFSPEKQAVQEDVRETIQYPAEQALFGMIQRQIHSFADAYALMELFLENQGFNTLGSNGINEYVAFLEWYMEHWDQDRVFNSAISERYIQAYMRLYGGERFTGDRFSDLIAKLSRITQLRTSLEVPNISFVYFKSALDPAKIAGMAPAQRSKVYRAMFAIGLMDLTLEQLQEIARNQNAVLEQLKGTTRLQKGRLRLESADKEAALFAQLLNTLIVMRILERNEPSLQPVTAKNSGKVVSWGMRQNSSLESESYLDLIKAEDLAETVVKIYAQRSTDEVRSFLRALGQGYQICNENAETTNYDSTYTHTSNSDALFYYLVQKDKRFLDLFPEFSDLLQDMSAFSPTGRVLFENRHQRQNYLSALSRELAFKGIKAKLFVWYSRNFNIARITTNALRAEGYLEEKIDFLTRFLKHRTMFRDGFIDMWERQVFPEVHRWSMVKSGDFLSQVSGMDRIKSTWEKEAQGFLLGFFRQSLIEAHLEWRNLARLDFSGIASERRQALLKFYTAVIPLLFDPERKLRFGETALRMFRQEYPRATYQEELEAIKLFFPEPSESRDEKIDELFDHHEIPSETISADDLWQTRTLYSGYHKLEFDEELTSADGALQLLQSLCAKASRQDKVEVLLWLLKASDKTPSLVFNIDDKNNLDFSTLPEDARYAPKTVKKAMLAMFLTGENGILNVRTEKEIACKRQFAERLFDHYFPEQEIRRGNTGIDAETLALLREIFAVAVLFSDQGRGTHIVQSLIDMEQELQRVSMNERLVVLLTSFGPVGVKVGQYLSENRQLVTSDSLRSGLSSLKDNAQPFAKLAVIDSLIAAGYSLDEIRVGKRLGSASMMQVHAGKIRKPDGTWVDVVFKVLRPAVQRTIRTDLEILGHVQELLKDRRDLDVGNLKEWVEAWLTEEMDLARATKNSEKIRNMVQASPDPDIRVPEVYVRLGQGETVEKKTGSVIVEERVKGIELGKLLKPSGVLFASRNISRSDLEARGLDSAEAKALLALDQRALIKRVRTHLLYQIFVNGVFHADLHASNIMVGPGTLYFIDMGLIGQLNVKQRESARKIVKGVLIHDTKLVLSGIQGMLEAEGGTLGSSEDAEKIASRIAILFSRFSGNTSRLLNEIGALILSKNKGPGSATFSLFIKAFTQAIWLFPDIGPWNAVETLGDLAKALEMTDQELRRALWLNAASCFRNTIASNLRQLFLPLREQAEGAKRWARSLRQTAREALVYQRTITQTRFIQTNDRFRENVKEWRIRLSENIKNLKYWIEFIQLRFAEGIGKKFAQHKGPTWTQASLKKTAGTFSFLQADASNKQPRSFIATLKDLFMFPRATNTNLMRVDYFENQRVSLIGTIDADNELFQGLASANPGVPRDTLLQAISLYAKFMRVVYYCTTHFDVVPILKEEEEQGLKAMFLSGVEPKSRYRVESHLRNDFLGMLDVSRFFPQFRSGDTKFIKIDLIARMLAMEYMRIADPGEFGAIDLIGENNAPLSYFAQRLLESYIAGLEAKDGTDPVLNVRGEQIKRIDQIMSLLELSPQILKQDEIELIKHKPGKFEVQDALNKDPVLDRSHFSVTREGAILIDSLRSNAPTEADFLALPFNVRGQRKTVVRQKQKGFSLREVSWYRAALKPLKSIKPDAGRGESVVCGDGISASVIRRGYANGGRLIVAIYNLERKTEVRFEFSDAQYRRFLRTGFAGAYEVFTYRESGALTPLPISGETKKLIRERDQCEREIINILGSIPWATPSVTPEKNNAGNRGPGYSDFKPGLIGKLFAHDWAEEKLRDALDFVKQRHLRPERMSAIRERLRAIQEDFTRLQQEALTLTEEQRKYVQDLFSEYSRNDRFKGDSLVEIHALHWSAFLLRSDQTSRVMQAFAVAEAIVRGILGQEGMVAAADKILRVLEDDLWNNPRATQLLSAYMENPHLRSQFVLFLERLSRKEITPEESEIYQKLFSFFSRKNDLSAEQKRTLQAISMPRVRDLDEEKRAVDSRLQRWVGKLDDSKKKGSWGKDGGEIPESKISYAPEEIKEYDRGKSEDILETFFTFEGFMNQALFNPDWGYYSSGKVQIKQDLLDEGHFRTFPESMSPYFGELIGKQVFNLWKQMKTAGQIKPQDKFRVLEFGAGNGTLAYDLLSFLTRQPEIYPQDADWKEFVSQLRYVIGEKSEFLREKKQRPRLAIFGDRVEIRDADARNPEEFTKSGFKGVIVSNELPDAFGVERVRFGPRFIKDGYFEVCVAVPTLSRDVLLQLGLAKEKIEDLEKSSGQYFKSFKLPSPGDAVYLSAKAYIQLVSLLENSPANGLRERFERGLRFKEIFVNGELAPQVQDYINKNRGMIAGRLKNDPRPFIIPVNPSAAKYIQSAAKILNSEDSAGYVLTIDYGGNSHEIIRESIGDVSLRTYSDNEYNGKDYYVYAGYKDLTADVDATYLHQVGKESGLTTVVFGHQGMLFDPKDTVGYQLMKERQPLKYKKFLGRSEFFLLLQASRNIPDKERYKYPYYVTEWDRPRGAALDPQEMLFARPGSAIRGNPKLLDLLKNAGVNNPSAFVEQTLSTWAENDYELTRMLFSYYWDKPELAGKIIKALKESGLLQEGAEDLSSNAALQAGSVEFQLDLKTYPSHKQYLQDNIVGYETQRGDLKEYILNQIKAYSKQLGIDSAGNADVQSIRVEFRQSGWYKDIFKVIVSLSSGRSVDMCLAILKPNQERNFYSSAPVSEQDISLFKAEAENKYKFALKAKAEGLPTSLVPAMYDTGVSQSGALRYYLQEWIDGPTITEIIKTRVLEEDELGRIAQGWMTIGRVLGEYVNDPHADNMMMRSDGSLVVIVDLGEMRPLKPPFDERQIILDLFREYDQQTQYEVLGLINGRLPLETAVVRKAILTGMKNGLGQEKWGGFMANALASELKPDEREAIESFMRDSSQSGPAVDSNAKHQDGGSVAPGGIDFRQLPANGQPAIVPALMPQLQKLAANSKMKDLDQEWNQIRGEMLAPEMPYSRIKEYIAVCLSRPDCRKKLDQAVCCIIDILRMEEDQALATNQELKDILMYLS